MFTCHHLVSQCLYWNALWWCNSYITERPEGKLGNIANKKKKKKGRKKIAPEYIHPLQQRSLLLLQILAFTLRNVEYKNHWLEPQTNGGSLLNCHGISRVPLPFGESNSHWPVAFSRSLGPTGRLCCQTRSPPHTPAAPAAAPSPTPMLHLHVGVKAVVTLV